MDNEDIGVVDLRKFEDYKMLKKKIIRKKLELQRIVIMQYIKIL